MNTNGLSFGFISFAEDHAMRTLRSLIASLAVFTGIALFTGCGAEPGRTIVTQGASAEAVMGTALQSGEYMLYTAASPIPTETVRLKEGDQLGFRRADDGHLVAVASAQSFDLPKGTAQASWKLEEK